MSEGSGSATGTAAAAGTNSVAQPETSEVGTGASVAIPHVQLQLPAPDEIARPLTAAPSLLQQSAPATAATSMLTIVPVEDEKAEGRDQGATGAEGEGEGEASASGNVDLTDGTAAAAQPISSLPPASPQVIMTFLLISGTRRGMSFDPSTTVGRVKELVWNAWPGGVYNKSRILLQWDAERGLDCPANEEKPPAPNYLRILYLGKILQDEDTLAGKSRVRLGSLELLLDPLPFGCEMENRALVFG